MAGRLLGGLGDDRQLRGPPILATIYCTESAEPLSSREQVIAEVSQITARTFGS
jgi:hypothetical protein